MGGLPQSGSFSTGISGLEIFMRVRKYGGMSIYKNFAEKAFISCFAKGRKKNSCIRLVPFITNGWV